MSGGNEFLSVKTSAALMTTFSPESRMMVRSNVLPFVPVIRYIVTLKGKRMTLDHSSTTISQPNREVGQRSDCT